MNNQLFVSGSPHVHSDESVKKIMWAVVIALLPALVVSVYYFGLPALLVTVVSILSCLIFEYLIQRFLIKGQNTLGNGSAVITGLLLAFNLPSNLPLHWVVVGALVAIGIGKMAFGGLGNNPFNPALVGRVFLLISRPVEMTSWPRPTPIWSFGADAITGPTPLGIIKEGVGSGKTIEQIISSTANFPSNIDMLFGQMGGSFGEVSFIVLLVGALFLIFRKVITWHIPVSFIVSAFLLSGVLYLYNPACYANPFFHIITGGLMLGACFMATDMVTSPTSPWGMIVFGTGCGILTIVIRIFGAYPEGVSFAILLMNAFTPLINKAFKPKRFGEKLSVKC
ncbi:MAG: RnfABCDGE type electron transport complex subunit D [Bacteroidetes bacterium]|nr:RnfABCDGE type electron transport complex subunit D [Bacteroidota bacterium]MCL1969577.1 RnfABCDGE type electron transport complex subunit D [Bacteroidota bacterium]